MTFISTNIVKQGTKDPVFSPYAVVEVKGTSGKHGARSACSGVDRYSPVWQKAGPAGTNLGMAAPADMIARRTFRRFARKSDVVVLLAAVSKDDAHELAESSSRPRSDLRHLCRVSQHDRRNRRPRARHLHGKSGKRVGETRVTLDDEAARSRT